MGAPKQHKPKYETPKKPYDRARLERERKVRQDFGLRRKKEIWRAESLLRRLRQRARELQAKRDEAQEHTLFATMRNMGVNCTTLEDVLEIGLEDLLSRRLQTVVHKKGLAHTQKQARQFIVHGHILINGRRVVWPSYLVSPGEEGSITVTGKIIQSLQDAKDKEKKK